MPESSDTTCSVGSGEVAVRLTNVKLFPTNCDSHAHYLHAENRLGVSLQGAEQQAVAGVADTDAAVVGAHQQHSARALLRCAQAAHPPGTVALKHIQLPLGLRPNEGRGDKGRIGGQGEE